MTSVDNRVVRMEFDNAQFEKGVSESIKSLKNMDQALKLDTGASGLQNVQKAADKLSFKNAENQAKSFKSTMVDAVKTAAAEITSLGSVAKATALGLAALTPVALGMTGGWSRALKIDEAKFKFKGLLKDVEDFDAQWNLLSKDINFGVEGAAYGFDQAASAAAQLVASGIKFGEAYNNVGSEMAVTLRAISGLTAMTGSSYEEISQIITQMAASGRVTSMDLERFATRSLKASATLAEGLEISEEELANKIRKGEIDFMTFIEVMDKAYGQHAKEANETFNGAISNLKAALNKIGAEFAGPLQHFLINVANAIRPFINLVKDALGMERELHNLAGESLGSMSIISSFVYNIEHLGSAITGTLDKLRKDTKFVETFKKAIQALNSPFDLVFHSIMEFGTALVHVIDQVLPQLLRIDLTPLIDTVYEFLYSIVDMAATELTCLGDILGLVADIAADLWSIAEGPLNTILDIVKNVVGGVMDGVFKAIRYATYLMKLGFDALNGLSNKLMEFAQSSTAFQYLKSSLEKLLTLSGDVSKFSESVSAAGEQFVEAFKSFTEKSGPIVESLLKVFDAFGNLGVEVLVQLFKELGNAVNWLQTSLSNFVSIGGFSAITTGFEFPDFDVTKTSDFLNGIATFIDSLTETLRDKGFGGLFENLKDFIGSDNGLFETIKTKIQTLFNDVTSFFSSTASDAFTFLFSDIIANLVAMNPNLQNLAQFFRDLPGAISYAIDGISNFFSTISNTFLSYVNIPGIVESLSTLIDAILRFADKNIFANLPMLGEAFKSLFEPLTYLALFDLDEYVRSLTGSIRHFAKFIGNCAGYITGASDELGTAFSNLFGNSETVAETAENIDGVVKSLSSIPKNIGFASKPADRVPEGHESLGAITDYINFGDLQAVEEANPLFNQLASSASKLGEAFAGLSEKIGPFFTVVGSFALEGLAALVNKISGLVDGFLSLAGVLPKATNGLKAVGDISDEALQPSLWDNFVGKIQSIGESIADFVGPYLTIENVVYAISSLISGVFLGALTRLLYGMAKLPGTLADIINAMNPLTHGQKFIKKATNVTNILKELGRAVLEFAVAAAILTLVDPAKLMVATAAIVGFVTALVFASNFLVNSIGAFAKSTDLLTAFSVVPIMLSMAAFVKSFAIAIAILAGAMLLISAIPADKFGQALTGIIVLLGSMIVLCGMLSSLDRPILDAAKSMALFGVALMALTLPLIFLGNLDLPVLLQGLASVMSVLFGMAAMTNLIGEGQANMIKAASAITSMAYSIFIVATAVKIFGEMDPMTLLQGGIAVGLFMLEFALLTRAISKEAVEFGKAGAAIVLMAASLSLLILPIAALSELIGPGGSNLGPVFAGTLMLVFIISTLTVALDALAKSPGVYASGKALQAASVGLIGIAAALAIFSAINPLAALASIGMLAIVIGALGVAGKLLAPAAAGIWTLSMSFLVFGAALNLVGIGLVAFSSGMLSMAATMPFVVKNFITGANDILQFFSILGEGIGNMIGGLIDSFTRSLSERVGSIKQSASILVRGLASGIEESSGDVAISAVSTISQFLTTVGSNIGSFINAGLMLIASFLSGIGRGLAQNKGALVQSIWDVFNGIAQVVMEVFASLVEKIPGVGPGLAEGMRGWIEDVAPVSEELANSFAENTTDDLSNASDQIGEEGMQAAADSMTEHADVMEEPAQASADVWSGSFMDNISNMDLSNMDLMNDPQFSQFMNKSGEDAAGEYTSGATGFFDGQGTTNLVGSVTDMLASAGQVDSNGDNGENVGNNFSRGILRGLNNWEHSISEKAREMVAGAKKAANDEMDAASPSKDMIKSGGWFAEGFLIGIANYSDDVAETAGNMVYQAKGAVNEALTEMDRLMQGIDWDAQPTIRPIFDGSEALAGLQEISGMMPQANLYAAAMIGSYGSRAFGTPDQSSQQTVNNYNITLDWEAGMDANDMVMALGSALRSQSLMYA